MEQLASEIRSLLLPDPSPPTRPRLLHAPHDTDTDIDSGERHRNPLAGLLRDAEGGEGSRERGMRGVIDLSEVDDDGEWAEVGGQGGPQASTIDRTGRTDASGRHGQGRAYEAGSSDAGGTPSITDLVAAMHAAGEEGVAFDGLPAPVRGLVGAIREVLARKDRAIAALQALLVDGRNREALRRAEGEGEVPGRRGVEGRPPRPGPPALAPPAATEGPGTAARREKRGRDEGVGAAGPSTGSGALQGDAEGPSASAATSPKPRGKVPARVAAGTGTGASQFPSRDGPSLAGATPAPAPGAPSELGSPRSSAPSGRRPAWEFFDRAHSRMRNSGGAPSAVSRRRVSASEASVVSAASEAGSSVVEAAQAAGQGAASFLRGQLRRAQEAVRAEKERADAAERAAAEMRQRHAEEMRRLTAQVRGGAVAAVVGLQMAGRCRYLHVA